MLKKILNKDVKEYKAKDVITKNVITLPPSESLLKAQSLITKYRIKKIVVVEDDIDSWHYSNKRYTEIRNF